MVFGMMLLTVFTAGYALNKPYIKETPLTNGKLPVELQQTYDESTNPSKLKAMLKGSIYETGEQMTVFGACFDGYGYLIEDPTLNATLSSWYANGTAWETSQYMTAVLNSTGGSTGRWRYQVNMPNVSGTYLTEITCMYQGDTATAYGEWQNPDWVKRIKDTQDSLANYTNISSQYYNNLSNQILNFSNQVQNNFSQIILQLSNLTVNGGSGNLSSESLVPIYNLIKSMDLALWSVDTTAPYYTTLGGSGFLSGIDMLSNDDVYIYAANQSNNLVWYWDGETWSSLDVSLINAQQQTISAVSVVDGNTPFAWFSLFLQGSPTVGDGIYSVNGGAPQEIIGSSGNSSLAIEAFKLTAESDTIVYLIEESGIVWVTFDNASSWSNPINFSIFCTEGHISSFPWYDNVNNISRYSVLMSCAETGDFIWYNGTDYIYYSIPESSHTKDVFMLDKDTGYVVSGDVLSSKVWKFDNGVVSLAYDVGSSSTMIITSIVAASENDIWFSTNGPGSFYHYDGVSWRASTYQYGYLVNPIYPNNLAYSLSSINELTMYDAQHAYAIGGDGTVYKLYTNYNKELDEIKYLLGNLSVNVNLTDINSTVGSINMTVININVTVSEIKDIVLQMNSSFSANMTEILNQIAQMNNSVNAKLDSLLINQTYMQLYLETTLFPMVNATYQNTLLILSQLGIIETNVNATLSIVNQTQQQVANISIGVDELVNKSRRIRAWITV